VGGQVGRVFGRLAHRLKRPGQPEKGRGRAPAAATEWAPQPSAMRLHQQATASSSQQANFLLLLAPLTSRTMVKESASLKDSSFSKMRYMRAMKHSVRDSTTSTNMICGEQGRAEQRGGEGGRVVRDGGSVGVWAADSSASAICPQRQVAQPANA
jgi:hypothetical protein